MVGHGVVKRVSTARSKLSTRWPFVVGAVLHIIAQHLRIPFGKGALVAEVLQHGIWSGQTLRRLR